MADTDVTADTIVAEAETAAETLQQVKAEIAKAVFGQERVVELALAAVLGGGHALLIGAPGLAKTRLVEAMGTALGLANQRIQFTPDLMPSDILGSEVLDESPTGQRSFRFLRGPIFTQLLMADEINRASPRTQSALLQAMQERHVTVAGMRHDLPAPFHVLATQNPLEQEGTYPLPEAQLDRFLFKIVLDYPSLSEEIEITRRARTAYDGHVEAAVSAVLKPVDLLALRDRVDEVFIEERVERFAVEIVVATRKLGDYVAEWRGMVQAGASPRASIALLRAASARAFLERRDYVLPEDVIALAPDVLRHRLVLDFAAEADAVSADDIVHRLIAAVPAP